MSVSLGLISILTKHSSKRFDAIIERQGELTSRRSIRCENDP
ncbi:hypothetical protein HORM4_720009 [Vibrio harveyi]|nr:hypothetical protein HORM4_720009 [Vibrio harveyi]